MVPPFSSIPRTICRQIHRLVLCLPLLCWRSSHRFLQIALQTWYVEAHVFREQEGLIGTGPIVRYGPHRIAMNSNVALREIYHVRANCQKSQLFTVFSHFFKVPMVMTTIDHKEHAFKRRIAAEALTAKALKQMEPGVMRNVNVFCDKMIDDSSDPMKTWNSARNMSDWCGWLANDIMGDITFHRNWNMLTSEENRDVLKTLNQGVGGLNMASISDCTY